LLLALIGGRWSREQRKRQRREAKRAKEVNLEPLNQPSRLRPDNSPRRKGWQC
jgi:hypothetical protein